MWEENFKDIARKTIISCQNIAILKQRFVADGDCCEENIPKSDILVKV